MRMSPMDMSYSPEAEAFRSEIREWLVANLPKGWGEPGFDLSPEARKEFNENWPRKLYEGGWICATWPKEYGGKGLTTM
ncbi:MAG: acyl-CoA dehydrogenase, partial [Actinobacteria bacterium]|nr:acyl-CoA dehydrogenase [Actinomycetota bacterium]